MKKIILLGAGRIGKAIVHDLCINYEVTAADISEDALHYLGSSYKVNTICMDIRDSRELSSVISDYDLVISAVPGYMGFETLRVILEAGKHVVDISFFDEDPFLLSELALKKKVTAIVDCGVAPGLNNIILGHHSATMKVEEFICMVGGLPNNPQPPFRYKAPFSPVDVLEEYTRPARIVENNQVVTKAALSEREIVFFDQAGNLEAFNTDGLRTLLQTHAHIPFMKEKTLRFPGHAEMMEGFKVAGFFDKKPVQFQNCEITPMEFSAALLFKQWHLEENEPDFTAMKILISGETNLQKKKIEYHLMDHYDPETGLSSMARTTGFTCTAAANAFLNGYFSKTGICPPEYLGMELNTFEFIMQYLKERGVVLVND